MKKCFQEGNNDPKSCVHEKHLLLASVEFDHFSICQLST